MIKKQNKKRNKVSHTPLHHHVLRSLLSVAEHKHTGKIIHPRHTSHGVMIALLIVTGIILSANIGMLNAYGVFASGQVSVGLTVNGTAPTIGATISSPKKDVHVTNSLAPINGTCPQTTLVAIYKNGSFAGSTVCTPDNAFSVTIQLQPGKNILQAQNYDALNQAGPVTSQTSVTYDVAATVTPATATAPNAVVPEYPVVQDPAPQPSENPCYDSTQTASDSNGTGIRVSCIVRNVTPNQEFRLPVTIAGGISPYAISVDWGDEQKDLKSFLVEGNYFMTHTYKFAGAKYLELNLSDGSQTTSFVQTVVSVNGTPSSAGSANGTDSATALTNSLEKLWVEAPVPLYWSIVALTSGFWIGDLFNRFFGLASYKVKSKLRRQKN